MTVRWNDQLRAKVEAAAFRGVVQGTNIVRNNILHLIRDTPKSGREYRRRGRRSRKGAGGTKTDVGWHVASAPGEAPAVDYGVYVRGIEARYDRARLRGWVNSSGVQARALEYGTSRMKPRPHMRPGLLMSKDAILKAIADNLKRALGS